MQEVKKLLVHFLLSGKNHFENGVIIPSKTRDCMICKDSILCEECKLKTKQIKEFEANLNELKENLLTKKDICSLTFCCDNLAAIVFEILIFVNIISLYS